MDGYKVMLRCVAVAIAAVQLTGCATALTLSTAGKDTSCNSDCNVPHVYSGTAMDVCGLTADNLALFALLDLPLSLVADTIVLPYTVYAQNKYGDISVKGSCTNRSEDSR
jgi:uncharacterized protein YceK